MNNVEQVYKTIQADKKVPSEIRKAGPFEALVLLAKARNTKHATAILNCFNKLLVTDSVEQGQLKDVIEALSALAHTAQDIQVKVLQTLPLFISSGSYTLAGQQLGTCLEIPISLLNVSGIVGSISSATLQQMLVSLFDSPSESRESDVSRIFEDLCASFSGAQSGYVSFESVKNTLILELLESILESNSSLFEKHPSLIDANLLSTIITLVQDETCPHPLIVRALRVASLLYPTKARLLKSVLEFLPQAQLIRQVLILESLETSAKDISHEQYPHIISTMLLFEDSILGVGTYSVCLPSRAVDEQFTADGLMYSETGNNSMVQDGFGEWDRPPRRILSQISAVECPKFNAGYKSLLLVNILSLLSQVPETIWRDTLVLHSAFLSSCLSYAMETQVLSDLSITTQRLNVLDDTRPRDLYLRRLGRIAVSSSLQADSSTPVSGAGVQRDLVHRSFSCLDTYLGIITALRDSFDIRAWAQILDILSTADSLLTMRTRRSSRQTGSLMGSMLGEDKPHAIDTKSAADMSRLSAKIEELFKTSDQLSNESFAALMEAICSMHVGIPGSPLTATPSVSRVSSPHKRMGSVSSMTSFSLAFQAPAEGNPFPLQKLMELLPINVPRLANTEIDGGWNHLLMFLTSEIRAGSLIAAEILGMTIVKASQCGLSTKGQQERFVYALETIAGEGPILVIQLETVASTLEILGHELLCGWDLILRILYTSITSGPVSDAEVVRLGFSCLQLVCTDFISAIPRDNLALLIETIIGFASQKEALNIALSAVGILWTILRVLPKHDFELIYHQFPEVAKDTVSQKDELLWLLMMENLVFMTTDVRPEVRNSSIQACFRTINTAESIGMNIWLSSIHLILQDLHKIPLIINSQCEGYIESVNIITSGTSKTVLSALEQFGMIDHTMTVWSLSLEFFKVVAIKTSEESAAIALVTLAELFADCRRLIDLKDETLMLNDWQALVAIGEGLYHNKSSHMSQEAIATYLNILMQLLESSSVPESEFDFAKLLELSYQGLVYSQSTTYYVDIDYLSSTQKPVLTIIILLLDRHHVHQQLVLRSVAKMLRLAPLARDTEQLTNGVVTSSWKGRPCYLMLNVKLQEIVARYYTLEQDPNFLAMIELIQALNMIIDVRYAKSSLADKSAMHNLWISATNQILIFVRILDDKLNSKDTESVWNELLTTTACLFSPHPNQSEEFVLATLNNLRSLLGPRLNKQKPAYIARYAEALYRGSWFHEQVELIMPSTAVPIYYKDQIIREWCFLELFKQAITNSSEDLSINGKVPEGHNSSPDLCADATLQYAIKRAQNILHRYINNAQLRANAPLPQIEYAELLLLLDHLADETILHSNQKVLLKSVYKLIVEALMVNQRDVKVLKLLKDTLMRAGDLL